MIGKLKSITTFFDDALSATKGLTVLEGIAKALPWWAEALGKGFAESVPVIKFFVSVVHELLKQNDPEKLAEAAVVIAYQKAVAEAFSTTEFSEKLQKKKLSGNAIKFDSMPEFKFSGLTTVNIDGHEYVKAADKLLELYATSLGLNSDEISKLKSVVHDRLKIAFRSLLAHGDTHENFIPLLNQMKFSEEELSENYLRAHVEYIRWQFEGAPMFQQEPFALSDVYTETDCGSITWGDFKPNQNATTQGQEQGAPRIDPFSEEAGGRVPLLEEVLKKIAVKENELILIQGVAGSGKSSFTLRLSVELAKYGFTPLRVRMRDLDIDQPVDDAISKALFPAEVEIPSQFIPRDCADPFLGDRKFDEQVEFRGSKVSKIVVILDGWDEISISAQEGFKVRVERLLEKIQQQLVRRGTKPVKVLLTGRPSVALEDCSQVLKTKSPLLTVRDLNPSQLKTLVNNVQNSLEKKPLMESVPNWSPWSLNDAEKLSQLLAKYGELYSKEGEKLHSFSDATSSRAIEVLGSPLLAFLALRLVSSSSDKDLDFINNPTKLLRGMVDLTCERAAKDQDADLESMSLYSGAKLRELLRQTAVAMTTYGGESIPYTELSLRLKLRQEEFDKQIQDSTSNLPLSSLLVAFFFKGGKKHLGCEFLHKSFREYLYAEAIVELLKAYGRSANDGLSERELYWKDFEGSDVRFKFSRDLSKAVASQWLSEEVVTHLEALLALEIEAMNTSSVSTNQEPHSSMPTSISKFEWDKVCDGLADLWDWWFEGVMLRCQVGLADRSAVEELKPAYVTTLVENDQQWDTQGNRRFAPPRFTTMDAHVGDALFRLCCWTHFYVARANGWLSALSVSNDPLLLWTGNKFSRRYQTTTEHVDPNGTATYKHFAPCGRFDFTEIQARVNAGGWRPAGGFPAGCNLDGTVFIRSDSDIPLFGEITLSWTTAGFSSNTLRFVNFSGATVDRCSIFSTNFDSIVMPSVIAASMFTDCIFRCCSGTSQIYCSYFISCNVPADFVGIHKYSEHFPTVFITRETGETKRDVKVVP